MNLIVSIRRKKWIFCGSDKPNRQNKPDQPDRPGKAKRARDGIKKTRRAGGRKDFEWNEQPLYRPNIAAGRGFWSESLPPIQTKPISPLSPLRSRAKRAREKVFEATGQRPFTLHLHLIN
jgi:hypothetical protein